MADRERNPEYEKFTKVMDGLMAVTYTELKAKMKKDKRKRDKKNKAKAVASSREAVDR